MSMLLDHRLQRISCLVQLHVPTAIYRLSNFKATLYHIVVPLCVFFLLVYCIHMGRPLSIQYVRTQGYPDVTGKRLHRQDVINLYDSRNHSRFQ